MTRPRLCIVDDHAMVRESLSKSLSTECDIVAAVASGDELLALLPQQVVDYILLDLHMPEHHGLEVLPEARKLCPAAKVLVVTMFLDRRIADEAFRLGAAAYVPKDASLGELLHAIREVMAGRGYLFTIVPKTSHRVGLSAKHPGLFAMTPRQHQIFLRLGEGKSWFEIAEELYCAPSTITYHKQKIMQRLAIASESNLRRFATLLAAEVLEAEALRPEAEGQLPPLGLRRIG